MRCKKISNIIIVILISIYTSHNSYSITFHENSKIGLISLFSPPLGLFYNNRIKYFTTKKKDPISLYPEEKTKIEPGTLDNTINYIKEYLTKNGPNLSFIPLPNLLYTKHLSGYFIEGIWGIETRCVDVSKIEKIFISHDLDYIIAIVPITYYLPPINRESSGVNLSIIKNEIYFSVSYAILIYKKTSTKGQNNKIYSSIKQVFYLKTPTSKTEIYFKNNKYPPRYIDIIKTHLKNDFCPHLSEQILSIINDYPRHKKIFPQT